MTYLCFKCGEQKPRSAFSSNGDGKYKTRCKPCRSADQSARYAAKSPAAKLAEFERIRLWVKANPDKYRIYAKATRQAKPEHYRSKVNMRRRRNRIATPMWADKQAIEDIYRKAAEITKLTGVPHEVDHIVPLLSSVVCGLHWEGNLQILTMIENKKKNNLLWPDMP